MTNPAPSDYVDFSYLDEAPAAGAAPAKVDDRPRFPCQSCAGTGRYRGPRVHQTESKCFACNGVGSFATSHADRFKARSAAAARKARAADAAKAVFEEANPGLVAFMRENASWSGFLRDILARFDQRGELHDNAIAAVRSTQAKVETRRAERAAAASAEPAVVVNLTPIQAMFDKAKSAGLKKLAYRAEGLVLTLAGAESRNPGAIYVKATSGEYLGKVLDMKFQGTRDATDEHKAALALIAANPAKAATDYGRRTGKCSCCGRELTDPESIARSIGPVCAEKWGF